MSFPRKVQKLKKHLLIFGIFNVITISLKKKFFLKSLSDFAGDVILNLVHLKMSYDFLREMYIRTFAMSFSVPRLSAEMSTFTTQVVHKLEDIISSSKRERVGASFIFLCFLNNFCQIRNFNIFKCQKLNRHSL